MHLASRCIKEDPYWFSRSSIKFQGHTGQKTVDLTPFSAFWVRFRMITQEGIDRWLWNCTNSVKRYGRGSLLFFKVIRKISRSHGPNIMPFWHVFNNLGPFRIVTQIRIHIWSLNDTHSFQTYRRGSLLIFKVIRQISRSHGPKKLRNFMTIFYFLGYNCNLVGQIVMKWQM